MRNEPRTIEPRVAMCLNDDCVVCHMRRVSEEGETKTKKSGSSSDSLTGNARSTDTPTNALKRILNTRKKNPKKSQMQTYRQREKK
jgi:hypothetical protein